MDQKREELYRCLEGRIGNTPLIEVQCLDLPNASRLFAKCEHKNPTESHYDRVYIYLLRQLEEQGIIVPGKHTLVETTSGNAGASFAWLCRELGYPSIVYMPDNLPSGRVDDVRQFGAEIRLTPGERYVRGAAEAMGEFLRTENKGKPKDLRTYFSPNHSQHFESITPLEAIATEALRQMREKFSTTIDVYIPGVGNGATVLGPGRIFKEQGISVVTAEPFGSAILSEMKYPGRFRELYGVEFAESRIQHEVYGTGVPDVSFPFIERAVRGTDSQPPIVDDAFLIIDRATMVKYRRMIGAKDPSGGLGNIWTWDLPQDSQKEYWRQKREIKGYWDTALSLSSWEMPHFDLVAQGHHVGRSSGLCVAAVYAHAEKHGPKNYLVIFYDSLRKYEDAERAILPTTRRELQFIDQWMMDAPPEKLEAFVRAGWM